MPVTKRSVRFPKGLETITHKYPANKVCEVQMSESAWQAFEKKYEGQFEYADPPKKKGRPPKPETATKASAETATKGPK